MHAADGAAPLDRNFSRRLDQVVDRAVGEGRIVGAVVLVARRGEILHGRAAGLADRESNKPMTPQAKGTWRWGGVYGHSWFVDPALDLTVVTLTNTAITGMTGAFPEALRDAIYGRRA